MTPVGRPEAITRASRPAASGKLGSKVVSSQKGKGKVLTFDNLIYVVSRPEAFGSLHHVQSERPAASSKLGSKVFSSQKAKALIIDRLINILRPG